MLIWAPKCQREAAASYLPATSGAAHKGAPSPVVPSPPYLGAPRDGTFARATLLPSCRHRGAGSATRLEGEDCQKGTFGVSRRGVINQVSKPRSKVSFDQRGDLSKRSFCCPGCSSVCLCPSIYLATSPFCGQGEDLVGPGGDLQSRGQHLPALHGAA